MQFLYDGAAKRSSNADKVARMRASALPWFVCLVLTACGGGGSGGGATGGFSGIDSDKSAGLEAVALAPIAGISSGVSGGGAAAPAPGVDLAPISGISTSDPGVKFGPISRTFGDPPFKLDPPSGVVGEVKFYSSNTSVATIAGNVVTIVGAGTARIDAQSADPSAPQIVGASAYLAVKKAQPILSMPPVTLQAIGESTQLQARTKSNGAIKYAVSNMRTSAGAAGDVAFLDKDGRTLTAWFAGTATITATQVPTANYEGGTISGNLVVEKRKSTISLNDLTQPFAAKLDIPVNAEIYDEVSDEWRTPTITLSNAAVGSASWDAQTGAPHIVLNAYMAGITSLTFSLPATTNRAAASKTVKLTLTPITEAQPGRQLAFVKGYTVYTDDYVFKDNVVTLNLCPSMSERVDFSFTESMNNAGTAHVTLNGVELSRDGTTGNYVAPAIPGVATGDAPLKLRSVVDTFSDASGTYPGTEFNYFVNVNVFPDPRLVEKCYVSGAH